jgi:hypothetical protein
MDDAVAAVLAAPLWAQIAMALFAATFVVMMVQPRLKRRKVAAVLADLARAAGAPTTRGDEFTEWFTMTVEGRPFEVRREFHSRGGRSGSSYRGPTGHLLVTSTPLAGSRWELHQVDITPGQVPTFFGGPPLPTGDATFDGRFVVMQDGVPVRDGWLDAPTRAAVTAFFDLLAATGPVWVRQQRLQHLAVETWTALDLPGLTALLRQQAALATALERTAGWRGPAA